MHDAGGLVELGSVGEAHPGVVGAHLLELEADHVREVAAVPLRELRPSSGDVGVGERREAGGVRGESGRRCSAIAGEPNIAGPRSVAACRGGGRVGLRGAGGAGRWWQWRRSGHRARRGARRGCRCRCGRPTPPGWPRCSCRARSTRAPVARHRGWTRRRRGRSPLQSPTRSTSSTTTGLAHSGPGSLISHLQRTGDAVQTEQAAAVGGDDDRVADDGRRAVDAGLDVGGLGEGPHDRVDEVASGRAW